MLQKKSVYVKKRVKINLQYILIDNIIVLSVTCTVLSTPVNVKRSLVYAYLRKWIICYYFYITDFLT